MKPLGDAGPSRSTTWVRVVTALLVPPFVMLVVAGPDIPYWDEPDQQVTVTASVPAGTLSKNKAFCDADRFSVVGAGGRTGHFRDCADEHAVGDRLTVRWLSPTSAEVGVDVWTLPEALTVAAGGVAVFGLVSVLDLRAERRRAQRAASPTFRTRAD